MILRPYAPVPFVVPYCALCDMPVERFAYVGGREMHERLVLSEPQSAYYLTIDAECCGKTQGRRITLDELMYAKSTGHKIFVVARPGRFQSIGALTRRASP